jgi:hypothetical protein
MAATVLTVCNTPEAGRDRVRRDGGASAGLDQRLEDGSCQLTASLSYSSGFASEQLACHALCHNPFPDQSINPSVDVDPEHMAFATLCSDKARSATSRRWGKSREGPDDLNNDPPRFRKLLR